ncbi:molybdopterin cofactor-binding domain-containing protein [Pseudomonas sp. NFACC39-1]|uniref:molybdopterin cofactor-binding domain-containing protein n=1 Tax=Pseudomonas sp. NFACC39-1 TaxID=1566195 RepID=UPI0008BA14F0|nr:molybdopterin cofactor-binding domain-containing protein [Pseudomonas sp. NFACC39-1]SEO38906.1 isoquinoline 1-oxidoreductase, beta subunit [Pseudomonas sp. NFACC39-1]
MSHPDAHDSALNQFTWPSTLDSNLDRKDLLLCVFAEQRFVAAQVRACKLDQKDYLLSLIDSASTVSDGTGPPSGFDANRMRNVIAEAATKGHWGKPSGHGRAQGIAAHYDSQTCVAVVLDVEVSDEGHVSVHDVVVVADLGLAENPGRLRSQLKGACLMGVAFVTSGDNGPTTANPSPVDDNRTNWPLLSLLPRQIAVYLINPTQTLEARQPSQPIYVPVVRALCNGICNAAGARAIHLPFRSQLLERTVYR